MTAAPKKTSSSKKKVVRRGIFCLEGEWRNNLKRRLSIEPVLRLLKEQVPHVPYIHRDTATREELFFYLNKWKQRQHASYPILYLGYYGSKGEVYLSDWRKRDSIVTIDDLEAELSGACKKRIIHLGSCGTLDMHGKRINRFLEKTGALAVCGYRGEIKTPQSAALELLVFDAFQQKTLTIQGVGAMKRIIKETAPKLARDLDFRIEIRK